LFGAGFPRKSWPFRFVASCSLLLRFWNQSIHATPAFRPLLPSTVVQSPAQIRMFPCYSVSTSPGHDAYKCVVILCCAGMPLSVRGLNFPLGQASQQQEPMFRMLNGGNPPIPTSSRYAFSNGLPESPSPRNARLILIRSAKLNRWNDANPSTRLASGWVRRRGGSPLRSQAPSALFPA